MNSAYSVAAQLYTVRDFCQTEADFAASMRKISAIGYRAVQVSGIGPISDAAVRRICDENGLKIVITHISWERLVAQPAQVIEQHRILGCPNVAVGAMPLEYRADEAGYLRFAREAELVGRKLSEAGLSFSYHNHSFEFAHFGKKTGLQILYEAADPMYLMAELDTYWIQHGGADPVEWILKMKGRMPVIHLKDMRVTADGWNVTQVMAEVGEGNLNWRDILSACRDAGVSWYAVEQDICPGDPFQSLKISYEHLKSWGLH